MQPRTHPAIARRREQIDPIDDRRIARAVASGERTRVTAGVFVPTTQWSGLSRIERHRLRVDEVLARTKGRVVLSHLAAAAVWGIDVLGPWPTTVDVTIPRASGGRSGGAIRRRALGLEDVQRVPYGNGEITTPAQTALDLARTLPFARAVGVVDQAIWTDRPGGALTTTEEICALLSATPRRGDRRAERAIGFADPLAANVRESHMRVVIHHLGFPEPRLQERRILRSGRLVFGDMYFPAWDHWLEIDCRGKYTSPEFGADRDAAEIVIDEKNRENEIRREVRGFSRLEATDADHPAHVYDVLTADGLPSSKPRPLR